LLLSNNPSSKAPNKTELELSHSHDDIINSIGYTKHANNIVIKPHKTLKERKII
jgi:hypothetical protein